jgi:hypothetical protein
LFIWVFKSDNFGIVVLGVYFYTNKTKTSNTTTGVNSGYQPFLGGSTTNQGNSSGETSNTNTDGNTSTTPIDQPSEVANIPQVDKFHQITDFSIAGAVFFEDTRPLPISETSTALPGGEKPPEVITTPTKNTEKKIGEETFLDAILKPHVCYFQAIKTLFDDADLHGMAHITGSGIEGNLERILPKNLDAQIDLSTLRVLPIFNTIQKEGNVSDSEMLRTYNMGVGLTLVVKSSATARIMTQIKKLGHDCYPVGNIVTGKAKVKLSGAIHWPS